jgi:hypothetical protein
MFSTWSTVLAGHVLLASCGVYSSILKMEAVRLSETSVNIYRTIKRHIAKYISVLYYFVNLINWTTGRHVPENSTSLYCGNFMD